MAKDVKYVIHKEIETLGINSQYAQQLSILAWNGYPPKYDIRRWKIGEDGELTPAKGIALSADEMQTLKEALNTIDDFEAYIREV